ncbi:MAG: hypothetical protein ACJ8GW_10235 [Massilia sp.]
MAVLAEPGGAHMSGWIKPWTWTGHRVGMLAYLLLFPGFFFYHTVLGLGAIGAFLGGYFAPVALAFAPPLVYSYAYRIRHDGKRLGRAEVFFILYLAYFCCVVGIQAIAGANPAIIGNHLLAILFLIDLFCLFRLVDFSRRDVWLTGLLSLFAMSAIVFSFSVDGAFYLAPLGAAKNPESLATYQGFSRSYLVTFSAVVACTRSSALRALLYCLAAPTLFLNTARSEFVAMLFMVPIVELYYVRRKLLLVSVLAVLFLVVYQNLDELLALLPNNRILELLDLSQSTSANKRQHLSMYALHTIAQFPIFGDYASYNPGFYSHNILSAWVDTGLFGFLFVLALLVLPLIQMSARGYFGTRPSGQFILAYSLASTTLLLLLQSHYFTDMVIGAALGSYSRYRYGIKHGTHRPFELGASAPGHAHLHQAVPASGTIGL